MNLKHAHDMITTLVTPVARQGSEADAPSGEVCLARGLNAPSGRVRLARAKRPLGRGLPRSRANAPSAEVRLARGLNTPSGRVRLARGLNAPSGAVHLARGLNDPSGEDRLARKPAPPRARSASLKGTYAHVAPAPAPVYRHLML
jgi:hypothetical protein